MATQQTELVANQTELITDPIELIEKLNCLEFETLQLNRAYQLWRPCVEQGTAPDWMAVAIGITYDALIYDVLIYDALILATEPTELIEKLNCLEFETSQLNRAYQLWRPWVEQGTIPDWMAAAISSTYDVLLAFSLDVAVTILRDVPHAFSTNNLAQLETGDCEISRLLEEESTSTEASPEFLPVTEPDWAWPETPVATSSPSIADEIWEEPDVAIQQRQQEEESTTMELSPELLPMTESDWTKPEIPVAISLPSTSDAIWEQPEVVFQQVQQEEESTIAEPSPELLPVTESHWAGRELPVDIFPPSTSDRASEQTAVTIQEIQQEIEDEAEPSAIHGLATLARWLHGSSTGVFFFLPPGAIGRLVRASLAILIVAGLAIGIYLVRVQRAALKASEPVQNSATQAAAGALAIPNDGKAEFKFDPDPVVAPLGSSFVLKAVLSRGSDIASVAAQIDYDSNLLQFMGVSAGGFLAGHQVVLGQRNDPSTGVLRISAEKSPGNPGISGEGPVFTLSFQARKRGKATVSIVPGAHDSQGRRIEMAGSQVSVKVN